MTVARFHYRCRCCGEVFWSKSGTAAKNAERALIELTAGRSEIGVTLLDVHDCARGPGLGLADLIGYETVE